ncbi:MAG TPA: VanW family protein [Thermomicrobiales bacterium]|nr:VanW family protein [Thermomicrobiales bacterium]
MQFDPHIELVDTLAPAEGRRAIWSHVPDSLQGKLGRLASRAILGLAVLLLLSAATLYWFRSNYDERIFPEVSVAGMPLSGMSYKEAASAVNQRTSTLNQAGVTFNYKGQNWSPTLSQLGITFDTDKSLDQAFAVGREPDAWDRMTTMTGLLRSEHSVPLVVQVDQAKMNAWFDTVDKQLGLPPHDAFIEVKNGKASIVPEVDGTIVDRAAAQDLIEASVYNLQPSHNALPVISRKSTIHANDLKPALQQLQTALSKPVVVKYHDKSWTLSAKDLGQFVVQSADPSKSGSAAISVSVDQVKLGLWLNHKLAKEVNRDPVNAKVGWNDGPVAVQDSVDGKKLKPSSLAQDVTKSFFSNHAAVDVPVATIKPDVDSSNLGALGITTRLAAGDSDFEGSDEGRATNIQVGANLLNGTLVPPHGDFSFNHSIGVIDTDAGFVVSQIIDGQDIGRDVGGGICQVSTTTFRAALLSGLPITEHWPHTFRLGFYELDGWDPGLDASILQPEGDPFGGGDLRFKNPFDSWLLVESYTNGTQVVVVIYGPDAGYNVKLDGPHFGATYPALPDQEVVDSSLPAGTIQQVNSAQPGIDVDWTRDVYDRNGNLVLEDNFPTHFYPRGNVWKVSPDMAGKSPAKS